MDKDFVRHIHTPQNTIHPLKKKKRNLAIGNNMDGSDSIMPTRERPPHVEFKQPRQTQAHRGGCRRPGVEGGGWVSWVKGAKRLKKKKKN